MKNWIKKVGLFSMVGLASFSVISQDKYAAVKGKVESSLNVSVTAIADSPVEGLLELVTNRGVFYASQDGKYFVQGRILDITSGIKDITETAMGKMRLDGLQQFEGNTIEFKAENEQYVVNVFTDITCGYCRKLHNEIEAYNDAGITVRYLAYPRAGLQSQSYRDMVSVWCAKDKQEAMTIAKGGSKVLDSMCANTVAEQYQFGSSIGVSGTPNIVLPNGSMIPGYKPASQLLEDLKRG